VPWHKMLRRKVPWHEVPWHEVPDSSRLTTPRESIPSADEVGADANIVVRITFDG